MAKVVAADLQINTTESVKAVKTAQQELRQLLRTLTTLDEGSAEFQRLTQRAGELRDQIGDINQRVNFLANDTQKLAAFTDIAGGIAGGFAAAQGAAALFGGESEDLVKVLTRVQGSMAVLQGIQAAANTLNKDSAAMVFLNIQRQRVLQLELVKSGLALRGWSAALAATGIGAVVVGLGLLVAWMVKSQEATEEQTAALERQKRVIDLMNESIKLQTTLRQEQIDTEQAASGNALQAAQQRLTILNEEIRQQEAAIEIEKRNIESLTGFENNELLKRRQNNLLQRQINLENLRQDLLAQVNIITEEQKKQEAMARNTMRVTAMAAKETFTQLATDLQAIATKANAESLALQIQQTKDAFNQRMQLEMDALDKQAAMNKMYRDNKLADERALEAAQFSIASQGFGALSQLAAAFSQSQGANSEKMFEISKKLAIAQATVDTISSAVAAYKSVAAIPIAGPALAVAAAAAATAAGLARIQQIRNTKFGGTGQPNVQAQVQQQTGIQSGPLPFNLPINGGQFVPVGQSPQGLQMAQGGMIRAFVVESDVTGVQARVRNARNLGELS